MASAKELAPLLPETLPEDFAEWDGKDSAASLPGGSDAGPGRPAAERDALPRNLPCEPSSSQADFSAEQERPGPAAMRGAQAVRELTAIEVREADAVLFQMFSGKPEVEQEREQPPRKMRTIVPVAAACLILIAVSLAVWSHHGGAKAAANRSAEAHEATAGATLETTTPKPAASQAAQAQPAAGNEARQTADEPSQQMGEAASAQAAAQAQARMMNKQLAAPSKIQRSATKQDPDNPLPSGWLGAEVSDGSREVAGVFNGRSQPVVTSAPQKPPVISSGVAAGMLVYRTTPVYPQAAKAVRLSGTVEVHATISKEGTIRDLQAVSGPSILRQAAIDAVRNWRYKPFELNNQPVEVETTVNVIFTLGG